jgi:hypothetical protein
MKKSLICLALAATVASVNVQAQDEKPGGGGAGGDASGALKVKKMAASIVGASFFGAIAANTNGRSPEREVDPGPTPPPPPPPTCNGDDALVDGVCIGSTITSTITGTGTGTATTIVTVPVTFTYSPSN